MINLAMAARQMCGKGQHISMGLTWAALLNPIRRRCTAPDAESPRGPVWLPGWGRRYRRTHSKTATSGMPSRTGKTCQSIRLKPVGELHRIKSQCFTSIVCSSIQISLPETCDDIRGHECLSDRWYCLHSHANIWRVCSSRTVKATLCVFC